MASQDLVALSDFAGHLVHDLALPVLAAGYNDLVARLAADTDLGEQARAHGIAGVLDSDSTLVAGLKKANKELVTVAEKDAERLMTQEVLRRFPDHAIVGEEHGYRPGGRTRWVFDPVDGTSAMIRTAIAQAFALHLPDSPPAFGITVGVVAGERAVMGLVTELSASQGYLVAGDTWIGTAASAPTRNGRDVPLPEAQATLANATLACTVPAIMFNTIETWSGYQALAEATKTCLLDQNCVGFMRVAGGDVDVVYEADLAYHDVAALVPILEGAGLVVTDAKGMPLRFRESAIGTAFDILAAAPNLHAQALEVIRRGVPSDRNTFSREANSSSHVQKF